MLFQYALKVFQTVQQQQLRYIKLFKFLNYVGQQKIT